MGMIRVSDTVERRLKELADGRSMNAVIEKMLAYCSSPDGFCPVPREGTYTPTFIERIIEKLDRLEELIKDTTIDRIDTPRGKGPVEISWEVMREVFFDFLREHDQEWVADSVFMAIHEADAPEVSKYFAEDGHIYAQGPSGVKSVALVITPRLSSFLKEKGVLL